MKRYLPSLLILVSGVMGQQITEASRISKMPIIDGDVLNDELEIACSNNKSIKVIEIQKEGKKIQKINEFLNGSKIHKGCTLNE